MIGEAGHGTSRVKPFPSCEPRTVIVLYATQSDRSVRQIQPNELCRQVDHAATADPRQQGLSPTGDGKHRSFPCIAAVRGRFTDHFYAYDEAMLNVFLCRRGVPSRLVIFPDENHWVLNHGNRWGCHPDNWRY